MIYAFIRAMLGTSGSAILDFYIAHSLWINGLILFYAILVWLARRSFDASQQSLIVSLQNQYGRQLEQKTPKSVLNALKKIAIPWEQAVRSSSFPLITPPGSIRVYPKKAATFQKLLPLEKLAEFLATH